MKYIFGKSDWQTREQGESRCFLLTNGLGGYCSQTILGSNARGDHALLIAAKTAPTERITVLHRLDEIVYVDGKPYDLSSQSFVTKTKNREGQQYLNRFCMDVLPEWEYMADGVCVTKRLCMPYGTNRLAVTYELSVCPGQTARLEVTPVYGFHGKNERPSAPCQVSNNTAKGEYPGRTVCCMEAAGEVFYLQTDGVVCEESGEWIPDFYYEQDARDGREGFGGGMTLHRIISREAKEEEDAVLTLLYTAQLREPEALFQTENSFYEQALDLYRAQRVRAGRIESKSGIVFSEAGRQLAVSAASFLTKRDSTDGMSVMAGFPFFGDWGRDTMIAFYGCTLAIGEKEAAKSILRTFMKYCRRGIMPNLFPEGNQEPLYNTVDASLLFLNAAWEYLEQYPEPEFVRELWPAAEAIVSWYACGTDYNIHMEEDGLLSAGSGLWQLTWMDVRVGDILPTPRHGKPVEINAYWYNGVKIAAQLLKKLYGEAVRAKQSQGNRLPEFQP